MDLHAVHPFLVAAGRKPNRMEPDSPDAYGAVLADGSVLAVLRCADGRPPEIQQSIDLLKTQESAPWEAVKFCPTTALPRGSEGVIVERSLNGQLAFDFHLVFEASTGEFGVIQHRTIPERPSWSFLAGFSGPCSVEPAGETGSERQPRVF